MSISIDIIPKKMMSVNCDVNIYPINKPFTTKFLHLYKKQVLRQHDGKRIGNTVQWIIGPYGYADSGEYKCIVTSNNSSAESTIHTDLNRMFLNNTLMQEREIFYLTTHSTHFIYGYMASDIWLRTILIVRKETCCRHIGYSYRLAARVLLYADRITHTTAFVTPVVEHWLL